LLLGFWNSECGTTTSRISEGKPSHCDRSQPYRIPGKSQPQKRECWAVQVRRVLARARPEPCRAPVTNRVPIFAWLASRQAPPYPCHLLAVTAQPKDRSLLRAVKCWQVGVEASPVREETWWLPLRTLIVTKGDGSSQYIQTDQSFASQTCGRAKETTYKSRSVHGCTGCNRRHA
jgi:hypothetical protein